MNTLIDLLIGVVMFPISLMMELLGPSPKKD